MNSALLILIALIVLSVGYKFYGQFISRVLGIDPKRKTPAHTKNDGVDFVPAKHWLVLFGHHFSSICGAGPIVGPVIAVAYWGWGVSFIWILIGSVLMGAVADFSSLVVSVRHGGKSIPEVARTVISPKARLLFSVFIWLSLILVIAVFAILAAKTFAAKPTIVVPSLGILPLAVGVGWLLYIKNKSLPAVTCFGLIAMALLLVFGSKVSVTLGVNTWILILIAYCFIASVTPVQYLLQPRDYLAGFILFAAIGVGILGTLISSKPMTGSFFYGWKPDPTLWPAAGGLWPMLFVTIACGAISGFHSLVSSGTTCKQLDTEAHACRVGYGGMLTEGLVACLVVCCVAAGLSHTELVSFLTVKSKGGPIAAFGTGYGSLASPLLGTYGAAFAIMALNAFILTTLDTATRISRYLTSELFGINNRYVATVLVVVASAALALTGQWQRIWPVFGASNQLIAALALLVVSCWLLSKKKRVWYILLPSFLMLITTIGAFVFQIVSALSQPSPQLFIAGLAAVLVALSLAIFFEAFRVKGKKLKLVSLLLLFVLPINAAEIKPLLKQLKSKESPVRVEAVQKLGELGDLKAVKNIIRAMKKHEDLGLVGVRALGQIKGERALKHLLALLESDNSNQVVEVAQALSGFESGAVTEALLEKLSKADDYGCRGIVGAFKRNRVTSAIPGLIKVLEDRKRQACAANAADTLGFINAREAIDPMIKTLRSPTVNRRLKIQVLRALGRLGGTKAYVQILSILKQNNSPLKKAALEAVAECGDRSAIPHIKRYIDDPDKGVRDAADYALKRLQPPPPPKNLR